MRSKWKGFVDNKIFKISQFILDKNCFQWDFNKVFVKNKTNMCEIEKIKSNIHFIL